MYLYRIKNFVISLIFALIFYYSYVYYMNYYFEYLYYLLFNPSPIMLAISFLVSATPILLYRGYKTISSYISIIIFIVLYIPTIITFALGRNDSTKSILFIQSVFFVSMCLFFMADRVSLINIKWKFRQYISFRFILLLTIICSFYPIYIYKGNLNLVSFEDVYVQRLANIDIGTDVVTRYLTTWLSTFLIPLCLLFGIYNKKYIYFVVGSLSCVILYMATAQKGNVLMPFIFIFFYYLLSKTNVNNCYSSIVLFLSVSIVVLLLLANYQGPGTPSFMAATILITRVIGTGGTLNLMYYDYFKDHPTTYYTHVGLINKLTDLYPYGNLAVSQAVGQYYIRDDVNANANFWATDGIASLGLMGVLLISVVFFLLLILLNTITKQYNKIFLALVFIPFLNSILNTSLFQTMWSGGGLFTMILLLLLKNRDFICKRLMEPS